MLLSSVRGVAVGRFFEVGYCFWSRCCCFPAALAMERGHDDDGANDDGQVEKKGNIFGAL